MTSFRLFPPPFLRLHRGCWDALPFDVVAVASSLRHVKAVNVPVVVLAAVSPNLLGRILREVEDVAVVVVEDARQSDLDALEAFVRSGRFALTASSRPRIEKCFKRLGINLESLDLSLEEAEDANFGLDDIDFETELVEHEADLPLQFEVTLDENDEDFEMRPKRRNVKRKKSFSVKVKAELFDDEEDEEEILPTPRRVSRRSGGQEATRIYTDGVQDKSKKYQCKECLFSCNASAVFKQHRIFHIRGSEVGEKLYFCPYCYQDFKTKALKDEHARTEHTETYLKCRFCRKSFHIAKKSDFDTHEAEHQIPKFKNCIQCGVEFPKGKVQALQHGKTHGPYHDDRCTQCPAVFNSWEEHKEHVETVHMGRRMFRCGYCGEVFDRKDVMKQHCYTVHGEETNRTLCPECGKNVASVHIDEHMRTHTDTEKVQCPLCPNMMRPKALKQHMRHRHNTQVCTDCGKQFPGIRGLQRHRMSTHAADADKPFRCRYCPKGFVQKMAWLDHENVHTGERPYRCDICHNTYKNASVRNQHVRTAHKGLKRTLAEEKKCR